MTDREPTDFLGALRCGLFAALVAVVPFLPSLGFDLVWDDPALVERVERAHARGGLAEVARIEFLMDPREPTGYYRPVVLLSLWLDGYAGDGSPRAYHRTNVALHAACTLLFTVLAVGLVGSVGAGLAAGLLFAVHPVHVESVAFVAGRTDLWAGLFVLAATLAWWRGRDQPARGGLAVASGAAYGLALLSKEVAVVLPVVLLLWDGWLPGAQRGGAGRRRRAPWVAAWAVAAGLVVGSRITSGLGPLPARAAGVLEALAADPGLVPQSLIQALALLTVPWPLHAFWERAQLAWNVGTALAALLGVVAVAAACSRRTRGVALAGAAWTVLFLLPVAGFVSLGAAPFAERFLYVPSMGFCLILGAVVARCVAVPRARTACVAAVAVLIVVGGAAAASRAEVWRSEVALFESIVRRSTTNAAMWDNLAQALAGEGRAGEAEAAYREALRLDGRRSGAWNGLGVLWGKAGRLVEARRALETAIDLDPAAPEPRYNLALLCGTLGDRACATEQRRALQSIAPDAAARIVLP